MSIFGPSMNMPILAILIIQQKMTNEYSPFIYKCFKILSCQKSKKYTKRDLIELIQTRKCVIYMVK